MAPDIIERLKASAQHQLCLPLLPFTHARSESINADNLNSQLPTARKKEWWRTIYPRRLPVDTVIHITHYFSRFRTHNLPIVDPTRYQQCHRLTKITGKVKS